MPAMGDIEGFLAVTVVVGKITGIAAEGIAAVTARIFGFGTHKLADKGVFAFLPFTVDVDQIVAQGNHNADHCRDAEQDKCHQADDQIGTDDGPQIGREQLPGAAQASADVDGVFALEIYFLKIDNLSF